jgi:hypothetical protein
MMDQIKEYDIWRQERSLLVQIIFPSYWPSVPVDERELFWSSLNNSVLRICGDILVFGYFTFSEGPALLEQDSS